MKNRNKGIILKVDAQREVSPPTPQYVKSYDDYRTQIKEASKITKTEADSLITYYNRATEATWVMSVHNGEDTE